ncbi:hypothetical protein SPRG_00067 [Saprolegnia parasitica CBS 223.65]|uniref:Thioredoxin domain-containing protein n=1 Tax=Saprolegnia parasitica (strain CBS 223.65) TaxID=695850 RepID=A0A067D9C7_SAPPC|nr:hypothetical protein SPRG_00067 [Saprolegnia parasitica CBS 223.65]KDO35221.1 hypothetical protein SPRG_00067 [Saprolegnia parasitica CBS 223.65]|eukprot:XP_012193573.1 hypothetical protein SPRG_00067 [Saprolegnia parasitica CBS 223.65]
MDQQGRRSEGLATTPPVDYGEVASDGSEASASDCDCDDSDDDSADGSDFEGEQDGSDASEASVSDCSQHDSDDDSPGVSFSTTKRKALVVLDSDSDDDWTPSNCRCIESRAFAFNAQRTLPHTVLYGVKGKTVWRWGGGAGTPYRLQELESLVDKFLENEQRSNDQQSNGLGIHNVT